MKNILTKLLLLLPILSAGQGQKTAQKNKVTDSSHYFTVVNWINLASTNPNEKELKMEEGDVEPGNYQVQNKYFQDILFFSTKSRQQIAFEAFLSINQSIRKKEFFKDADSISRYFHQKYEAGFFFDSAYEKNKKWAKSFYTVERYLTFEDFSNLISPNLLFELVKPVNAAIVRKQAKFTLVYNWDFFEETALPVIGLNVLLKTIHSLPVPKTLHAGDKAKLQYAALSNFDIWSYYPDSKIRGLIFTAPDLKKYKCDDLKLPFCNCVKTVNGYAVEPNTRNFNELYKAQYEKDKVKLSKDYQFMLDFFSQKMVPFRIWENVSAIKNQKGIGQNK